MKLGVVEATPKQVYIEIWPVVVRDFRLSNQESSSYSLTNSLRKITFNT